VSGKHKYPTVRLHSHIYEKLSERYGYGHSASTALERYFWLLESEKPDFTEPEWNVLFDAFTAYASQSEPPELLVQSLVSNVEDMIDDLGDDPEDAIDLDNLDTKWGVNLDSFLEKLNTLTSVQRLYTISAIEKFWDKVRLRDIE